jgi:dethiobiotin synthetase
MKGYFITATDTDAGKTYISSGLLNHWSNEGYRTLGFKPVASGCQASSQGLKNDDALKLISASNVALDYQQINPYAFEPAIAPHIAAQQVDVTIDLSLVVNLIHQQKNKADYVLVEGVGGWLVPLNNKQTIADLASLLGFPVILVVNMRLGCINHALLTIQAIQQQGLNIAGWIANNPNPSLPYLEENVQSIKKHLHSPLLGIVPDLSAHEKNNFSDFIDMKKLY